METSNRTQAYHKKIKLNKNKAKNAKWCIQSILYTKWVVLGDIDQIAKHDLAGNGGKSEGTNFEVAILDKQIVDDFCDYVSLHSRMIEYHIAHPHHGKKPNDEDEAIGDKKLHPISDSWTFNLWWLYELSSSCWVGWKLV